MKRRIYLQEFNVSGGDYIYLPLASGLIRAYSESIHEIADAYEFQPFIFRREPIDSILASYEEPSLALFSVAVWNEQFCIALSAEIKKRWPECLIVFGGAQVPGKGAHYFKTYPWIDVLVHGEGERTIASILERFSHSKNFDGIPGVSWYSHGISVCNIGTIYVSLDGLPSPYLLGLYDYLWDEPQESIRYQAILETNRGCPYHCSFCGWDRGNQEGGLRTFPISHIKDELSWMASNKIQYVFCADSNFGILPRDIEIAKAIFRIKRTAGYPDKIRACYAKDAEERVGEIASIFKDCDAGKSVTIARQSYYAEALRLVGRKSPNEERLKKYQDDLQGRGISTYTELILGLPGETLVSWIDGLELFMSGPPSQLFVYLAQVYPNALLSDPVYQQEHGIRTKQIVLTETHGLPRTEGEPEEYEEIVVETRTLSKEAFRYALILSWMVMLFHGMGVGRQVLDRLMEVGKTRMSFLRYLLIVACNSPCHSVLGKLGSFLVSNADRILAGGGRCIIMREFGPIYWDIEEAAYLILSGLHEELMNEIEAVFKTFLNETQFYIRSLESIMSSQVRKIPSLSDYGNDRIRYAREIVLHGRKSGAFNE